MKGDEEKALQSGFDRYVSKPIDVTMFRSLIRAYLAG
jgi:CheY-like chemotaxis protein